MTQEREQISTVINVRGVPGGATYDTGADGNAKRERELVLDGDRDRRDVLWMCVRARGQHGQNCRASPRSPSAASDGRHTHLLRSRQSGAG